MKILLPFQDPYNRPLTHPIVSGGTEQFCKSIKDNFNKKNNKNDETRVFWIPFEQIKSPKQSDKIEISQNIIDCAVGMKADIIICNFAQAIYNNKTIIESPIPIMFVEHCIYPIPNVIYRWNQAIDKGHSMFFVSKWQKKKYREMAQRTGQRVLPIDGYVNPSYCKVKPKLIEQEYDCGTIGRCDNGKKPFLLKQMTKGKDIKSLVITSKTQVNSDIKYYERNKHWEDTLWDLPYKEVMENISKCKTYFSTWNGETWGITAMEALSCGIPVILNSDKSGNHASEIIPASEKHYKIIPQNDKDALVKAIEDLKDVDRGEIQKMTWEKHSLKSWKEHMRKCMEDTVDKFDKLKNKK